jgi:phosphoglycolate phosphatase-like HAD superfamily hydrolase
MLDPVILTVMMERAGASQRTIRAALPDIYRSAERYYLRHAPADLRDKTCPGVRALLTRLHRRGALLGLVTGNLTRIGWHKLERAGLRDYFHHGAFGEMAKVRAGLAKWAIAEARRQGWIAKGSQISLIGDAPADIIAAKSNHIRAIAVRTGLSTESELTEQEPDLLLDDLRQLRLSMLE